MLVTVPATVKRQDLTEKMLGVSSVSINSKKSNSSVLLSLNRAGRYLIAWLLLRKSFIRAWVYRIGLLRLSLEPLTLLLVRSMIWRLGSRSRVLIRNLYLAQIVPITVSFIDASLFLIF